MICLDSCFLIDFLNGKKEALDFYESNLHNKMFVAEATVFEIGEGIIYSDSKRKTFPKKMNQFISVLEDLEVLPSLNLHSLESAKISASLILAGEKIDVADCMIAGQMFANGVNKIVTKNKKHFSKIKGIKVLTY